MVFNFTRYILSFYFCTLNLLILQIGNKLFDMLFSICSTILVFLLSLRQVINSLIIKETSLLNLRPDVRVIKHHNQLNLDQEHTVVFVVKPKNLSRLEKNLHEVSDPHHEKYGQHWSRAQIEAISGNKDGQLKVLSSLAETGIDVIKTSKYGNYIHVKASLQVWSEYLSTNFQEYFVENLPHTILRTTEYSLPIELIDEVETIFNTIHLPRPMKSKHIRKIENIHIDAQKAGIYSGYVSPALLNYYYNITSNIGNYAVSQSVYESLGQAMSPSDLTYFQTFFKLPLQTINRSFGTPNHANYTSSQCSISKGKCTEGNLDIQYLMAIAQNVNTSYYYTNDWMFDWILSIGDLDTPANVYSISYGSPETGLESSYTNSFNFEALKLGLMGVTLVVSSGDDGAPGSYAGQNPYFCSYGPVFPASSPYVTAVGATTVS
jgi:tripeptidyl-peptidase I